MTARWCSLHGRYCLYGCTRHAARPLTLVRDTKRCIVHDETYTTVCRGCRADEIAADAS